MNIETIAGHSAYACDDGPLCPPPEAQRGAADGANREDVVHAATAEVLSGERFSKPYDAELDALRSRVLRMGRLVESQIVLALEELASGKQGLIEHVIESELRVNGDEIDIDKACSDIVATRHPVGADLRLIMAVSKIVTDLERIGDEAEKIARMSQEIRQRDSVPLQQFAEIRHGGNIAANMLGQALDAFACLDAAEAAQVVREDIALDDQFSSIVRKLATYMMEDPRTISCAIKILWIAKAIERIGDHAKNVAEDVIYIVRAIDVRHTDLEHLERNAKG